MQKSECLDSVFALVEVDSTDESICACNDAFGFKSLFFFRDIDSGIFALSDSYYSLQETIPKRYLVPDIQGIGEFLVFNYPLFGKTSLKNVRRLPPGSVINISSDCLNIRRYCNNMYKNRFSLSKSEVLDRMHNLLQRSTELISKQYGEDSLGLGLSGGMDSRLVASLAIENGLSLNAFVYGNKRDDSYKVAKLVANELNIGLRPIPIDTHFFLQTVDYMQKYHPMVNLITSWPIATSDRLPHFKCVLTGFNGDNMFGSHLTKHDLHFSKDNPKEIVLRIIEKNAVNCNLADIDTFVGNGTSSKINQSIENFVMNNIDIMPWQLIEEFDFRNRQLAWIKNDPMLSLKRNTTLSPFMFPPLIRFCRGLPINLLMNRSLFKMYMASKHPTLSQIRSERNSAPSEGGFFSKVIGYISLRIAPFLPFGFPYGVSHKSFLSKLIRDSSFQSFLYDKLLKQTEIYNNVLCFERVTELIQDTVSGSSTFLESKFRKRTHRVVLLFALLTVKTWFDSIFV